MIKMEKADFTEMSAGLRASQINSVTSQKTVSLNKLQSISVKHKESMSIAIH
jgi:hypothetical protein